MLATGLYLPCNIYNMDEVGFDLSTSRKLRRVAPRTSSSKAQRSLTTHTHITVIAAISTSDAPIPPFLLYPGQYLMDNWLAAMDPSPRITADVTETGFFNTLNPRYA